MAGKWEVATSITLKEDQHDANSSTLKVLQYKKVQTSVWNYRIYRSYITRNSTAVLNQLVVKKVMYHKKTPSKFDTEKETSTTLRQSDWGIFWDLKKTLHRITDNWGQTLVKEINYFPIFRVIQTIINQKPKIFI